jgi:hypothetical protein
MTRGAIQCCGRALVTGQTGAHNREGIVSGCDTNSSNALVAGLTADPLLNVHLVVHLDVGIRNGDQERRIQRHLRIGLICPLGEPWGVPLVAGYARSCGGLFVTGFSRDMTTKTDLLGWDQMIRRLGALLRGVVAVAALDAGLLNVDLVIERQGNELVGKDDVGRKMLPVNWGLCERALRSERNALTGDGLGEHLDETNHQGKAQAPR